MRSVLIAAFLMILTIANVFGDVHVTQVTTTEPMEMMGNVLPGRTDTAQIWFAKDKVSLVSAEVTSLVRNDLGMLYVLMPHNNTYAEIPLTEFDNPVVPEVPAITATVTPTEESKKIREWNCKKYLVELKMKMGMTATQEVWSTEELDVDYRSLLKGMSGMMAGFAGFPQAMKEIEKVGGLPIYMNISLSVMGATMKSVSEVISAETTTAPEGTFEIPPGYTKVDPARISPH